MAKKLFGDTDGIRGKANYPPLDPQTLTEIGKALAEYTKQSAPPNPNRPPKVIIAKDTRRSGYMIEQALTSGFLSRGVDVMAVGPMPTPAVSHLVKSFALDLGVMITASHNQYHDNGIKVFNANGTKLTDAEEMAIEKIYLANNFGSQDEIGRAKRVEDAAGRYIEFVKSIAGNSSLAGLRVVVDCANGAAYNTAPIVFQELGAEVIVIANQPNGYNINDNCGSLFPENLRKTVLAKKADLGIAVDGDADRVIMVDEKGNIIDGDYVIALLAKYFKKHEKLQKNTAVITSYSNMALEIDLQAAGINVDKVVNGDRAIAALCREKGYNFGGEFSGHFLFLDYSDTGDGTLGSLLVLKILKASGKSLSEIAYTFDKFPQQIFNLDVVEKKPLEKLAKFQAAIKAETENLAGQGRVFARYSGTENKLRIMVEAKDEKMVEEVGNRLQKIADQEINS